MFTAEAEGRIYNHNQSKPLFLYLAYQAVHSANRPADPIQAPDSWIKKYNHIQHEGRRKFAAVMGYMDYGVGRVKIWYLGYFDRHFLAIVSVHTRFGFKIKLY